MAVWLRVPPPRPNTEWLSGTPDQTNSHRPASPLRPNCVGKGGGSPALKAVTRDVWTQFLDFAVLRPDFADYDPDGAWPLVFDEFVDHAKAQPPPA